MGVVLSSITRPTTEYSHRFISDHLIDPNHKINPHLCWINPFFFRSGGIIYSVHIQTQAPTSASGSASWPTVSTNSTSVQRCSRILLNTLQKEEFEYKCL